MLPVLLQRISESASLRKVLWNHELREQVLEAYFENIREVKDDRVQALASMVKKLLTVAAQADEGESRFKLKDIVCKHGFFVFLS